MLSFGNLCRFLRSISYFREADDIIYSFYLKFRFEKLSKEYLGLQETVKNRILCCEAY